MSEQQKKRCAIVCGAPDCYIPDIAGCFVIACDKGYEHCHNNGIKPDLIVGDFDSCRLELPSDIEIIRSVPEKDDTDTLLAVKQALGLGYADITLLCASGGRCDHFIANLQTMRFIALSGGTARLIDRENELFTLSGSMNEPFRDNRSLSVFALTDSATVSLCGVKYPLDSYLMRADFPIGVSNEIIGTARLTVTSGIALIVLSELS